MTIIVSSKVKVGDIINYSGARIRVIETTNMTEKHGHKDDIPCFGIWGTFEGGDKATFNYLRTDADRFDANEDVAYLQGNDRARWPVE
tara:strand:- start:1025 stop:1288 length:264 start_codon:yes stop_codon:yes gene_type:complete